MNEEETRKLIDELINSPHHCIFCGELMEEFGKTDTGYRMERCTKCGWVYNEE